MPTPTVIPMWLGVELDGNDVSDIVPVTADNAYPFDFPGYVGMEAENHETDAYLGVLAASQSMDANGNSHIDRWSYGEQGQVNRNAYSIFGPVEPGLVENFQLYGEVSDYTRPLEWAYGEVGSYDHASYTALQIAQQMGPEAYSEASIVQLLTEGI